MCRRCDEARAMGFPTPAEIEATLRRDGTPECALCDATAPDEAQPPGWLWCCCRPGRRHQLRRPGYRPDEVANVLCVLCPACAAAADARERLAAALAASIDRMFPDPARN